MIPLKADWDHIPAGPYVTRTGQYDSTRHLRAKMVGSPCLKVLQAQLLATGYNDACTDKKNLL